MPTVPMDLDLLERVTGILRDLIYFPDLRRARRTALESFESDVRTARATEDRRVAGSHAGSGTRLGCPECGIYADTCGECGGSVVEMSEDGEQLPVETLAVVAGPLDRTQQTFDSDTPGWLLDQYPNYGPNSTSWPPALRRGRTTPTTGVFSRPCPTCHAPINVYCQRTTSEPATDVCLARMSRV